MTKKNKKIPPVVIHKPKRTHRKAIMFNDKEMEVIDNFCKKYKIKNQTKFFRESIISSIIGRLEEDHPTLF